MRHGCASYGPAPGLQAAAWPYTTDRHTITHRCTVYSDAVIRCDYLPQPPCTFACGVYAARRPHTTPDLPGLPDLLPHLGHTCLYLAGPALHIAVIRTPVHTVVNLRQRSALNLNFAALAFIATSHTAAGPLYGTMPIPLMRAAFTLLLFRCCTTMLFAQCRTLSLHMPLPPALTPLSLADHLRGLCSLWLPRVAPRHLQNCEDARVGIVIFRLQPSRKCSRWKKEANTSQSWVTLIYRNSGLKIRSSRQSE